MSMGTMIAMMVVGAGFMVGGYIISKQVHLEFLENLEKQGIPLDLGKTLSAIGVFMIVLPLLRIFYFNPLSEAIMNRTSELENTFSEAESLRQEMQKMKTDYEQRLSATEARAREEIQAQIREAQNMRQSLMAEASAKAEEFLKKAQEEIAMEKERVLVDLRLGVVDMTLQAAERILGENVDDAKNRKLIQEFIDTAEVKK